MPDENDIRPKDVETIIQRKEVLRHYRSSGLSAAEFAASRKISRSTLYRHLQKEGKGPAALADKRGRNKGHLLKINNEMTAWLLQFYADHPQAGVAAIRRALKIKAAEQQWTPCPSYWWVRRFLKNIAKDVLVALRQGARERVETAAVTVRRVVEVPNALWQLDASEAPIWAFHPLATTSKINDSANYIKPWIIAVTEATTRTEMALQAFPYYPTTADALYTLRKAIAFSKDVRKFAYGKPSAVNTDNHKVFHPAGDWGYSLLMARIEPQQGPNESPHANGKVERFFQTAEDRIWKTLSSYADQFEGLAKAKEYCIPWVLFQRYLDRIVYENYHLVEHSELGMSPYEAWHARLGDAVGLVYDVPALDLALRVSRELTVATDGIEVAHLRRYTAPFLEGLIGEKVTVRIPPPPEPLPRVLPVSRDGVYLGEVTCDIDDSIAQALRDTRLERTIAIERLQNLLIKQGRSNPLPGDPSMSPAVVMKVLAESVNPDADATGLNAGPASGVHAPENATAGEDKPDALGSIPNLAEDETS